ncbi:hypothetical protein SERLA73DRAFT_161035 [Serpula lacrymans var. lacrymans S7.3]|uniref:Methyltransferase domain-containing protein n=2 Tax=Serpula lacrymans var. lacrymans TaxID=341189 RepID=F8Q1E2_SERL3|nr:uncharacterized protein SERLADRAFT_416077 [Serpula lacrymans var. lacrymans S7.9]EGN98120.1 hypothetical protein SERLA73DRAFT_161035 [Serpula lacrymans var. lacrymans S7.3]EGO23701.1 hypothetical protein SERLADRAFT_416077 [Serpula lacrymans var. lacrymans S7.9]
MSVLPDTEVTPSANHPYGMSPKKDHEVTRMSTFISQLLNRRGLHSLRHAVDVGSGQGYLSRALQDIGVHVLALDSNQTQTSGAERWKNKAATRKQRKKQKAEVTRASNVYAAEDLNLQISCFEPSPTPWTRLQGTNHNLLPKEGVISHKTVHITPQTLQASIQDWLLSDAPGIGARNVIGDISVNESDRPAEVIKAIPVLLVALHACGSLTPDILRTFVSNHRGGANSNPSTWKSQALVVVGCCYNLMSPADFPLSTGLRRSFSGQKLSLASLHLAAQVPSQWARTASSLDAARLAIRKVVYRALLQPLLQTSVVRRNVHMPGSNHEPDIASDEEARRDKLAGTGETLENRRLGKLNNAAYRDWGTFLTQAGIKMGVSFENCLTELPDGEKLADDRYRRQMESRLEVLHVLRCLLGPLVESLILLDRYDWLCEELRHTHATTAGNTGFECNEEEMDVELFNLFDQATGSGRNVAIVIAPR